MAKEKWFERRPVPLSIIGEVIRGLGTHATTIRIIEHLRGMGYRSEEDILSVLTSARRLGVLILADGWWRVVQ